MKLHIVATGIALTTSAASAPGVIPLTSAGTVPQFIRIAATQAAYVRIGTGAQTAISTDMIVHPAESVVLQTHGHTNIAALQVTTGGIVQVSPCEGV